MDVISLYRPLALLVPFDLVCISGRRYTPVQIDTRHAISPASNIPGLPVRKSSRPPNALLLPPDGHPRGLDSDALLVPLTFRNLFHLLLSALGSDLPSVYISFRPLPSMNVTSGDFLGSPRFVLSTMDLLPPRMK